MNLPSIEPILPEDNPTLPPARRRRMRRAVIPPDGSDRAAFLNMLSQRVVPSFDFFLFSLFSGLALGAGLLFDSPALVFLAALLAPFMAPVVGLALGTLTGSLRFFIQALISLLVSSLMVFVCGLLAGWMTDFVPVGAQQQAGSLAKFDWSAAVVLSLGVALTTFLTVRSPEKRPQVTSAAIAYGLYLPAGAAGYGLSSGLPAVFSGAAVVFALHLLLAALLGVLLLAALGLRPLNAAGYLLAGLYLLLATVMMVFGQFSVPAAATPEPSPTAAVQAALPASPTSPAPVEPPTITPSPSASPTASETPRPPSATPTRTLVPTRTATITNTPVPTPVWARINAQEGNGALIREEPDYNATIVQSMLNGNLVEVLPDVARNEGVAWVRVRTVNGKEGWVVRSLLATATPAPTW